jgi:uncharacterized protein
MHQWRHHHPLDKAGIDAPSIGGAQDFHQLGRQVTMKQARQGYLQTACHLLGLVMLCWLLPDMAQAQNSRYAICPQPGNTLLWQVEGGSSPVYLFGSIHVGKPDFYPLSPSIENLFQASDHLVFEVDPATVLDPAVIIRMQARGSMPSGQSLADVVDPEVIAQLRAVMAGVGLPVEPFMGMRPWFLTLVLTGIQMTMQGYDASYGTESYLLSRKSEAMSLLELESIDQQIAFLEALDNESFLRYTLLGFDQASEEIEAMMQAWQCADDVELAGLLFANLDALDAIPQQELDAMREKLFYERNAAMAATIQTFLGEEGGQYFVVVGSGHLLGERSIVELLQAAGYTVKPVTLDP